MHLIKGDIKIEFEHIGEGWSGDYDPNDPDDTPLLRFTVYKLDGGQWNEIENASYCTLFPDDTPDVIQLKGLQIIMDVIYFDATTEQGIKRKCQALSWLGPEMFL